MCGIAGFVRLLDSADQSDPRKTLDGMIEEISTRGPDGRGTWHDDSCHFGHCRLSIIDLSQLSAQPMRLENDELIITYNGEIYNYQALRQSLERAGDRFVSAGDTEVVLRGFKRYGCDWLKRLNGMFAAAIWSPQEKKLTLFRDRFGIKPLYWTIVGTTVVFASQIKCFLHFPNFRPRFNLHWLNEYLTFQNVHGSTTPFANVHLLEAGQALIFSEDTVTPERVTWARPRTYAPNFNLSPERATEQVAALFSNAVSNTLVSDVPVGSYLSGGIDSGAVVALASRAEPHLHTFTCGFDERGLSQKSASMNEIHHARELAQLLGSKYHEASISSGDIADMHHRILKTIEEPRVGVLYQNDVAARLASNFVRVCLSGAGGDEIFGGYPWRYRRIRHAQTREEFLRSYYGFWQRVYDDGEKAELLRPEVQREVDLGLPFERFADQFPESVDYTDIGVKTWLCLRYETEFFLHGLLQIGDRLAGAYALEERFPFLDNDLVDFVDTIPAEYHWDPDESPVDGQYFSGKRLLRSALSRLVPPEMTARRKQGFAIPVQEWFDGPLAQFVDSKLGSKDARIHEFVAPGAVERAMAANREGRSVSGAQVWSLLSVATILDEFFS